MASTPQQTAMPNDVRNDESGQFVPKYADADFLAAVDTFDEATTREVAEHVGADHDTARRRLNALADKGRVGRRRIAATILWSDATADTEDETEAPA